jgi:predicted O-methyltransferase YrrM
MFAYSPGTEQYEIIKSIVQATGCQKYLELGISEGINIQYISQVCSDCTGVDIVDRRKFKDFKFHHTTTDHFFKKNTEKFDTIFIDADHSFEQVKKDFNNSIKILNKFGIIFLHDTDPISKEYTNKSLCGDSFKIVDYIINSRIDWNIVTLPISVTGLSIVNRKRERRVNEHNNI